MIHFQGADGNRIAADVSGEAGQPTIILLHGGGQTRHSWRQSRIALAGHGFRVIALDGRGHGDSDWTTQAGYSIDRFGADLACVVDQLGSEVILIGASLGGLTSLEALAANPDLPCRALVLVDVVPRPNPQGIETILAFMRGNPDGFATIEDAARAVTDYLPQRRRGSSAAGLGRNLRLGADGRFRWHWDPEVIRDGGPGLETAERLEQVFAALEIPVLLVRGGSSEVVTEAELEAFRQLAPAARTVDIAGASHMVAGDRNDRFTGAILDFLGELAPA
ncbi:alpha/beta hydrolase [Sphingomonas sp. AOB5]|uniref:alpha/beta fold hydrolase n=1 Tax=Sphingomonas sp. AOB5 TaxID=3034017 RepID=UPI0023F8BC21|nr:alpha/beta hydrolase [Sphingomonas sp. AOB5]MDF7774851.1 alpha/beta hydrolase [Sphingomonas sp. AOB5]